MVKELTISQLKKKLGAMDKEELDALLLKLYKGSKMVKQIVNMELIGEPYTEQVLESYKKRLDSLFFPSNLGGAFFSLSEVKAVVKEFEKICTDEKPVVEIRLYFVECALEFTNMFGDVDSRFYDAVCRMYHEAVEKILKNEELQNEFDDRLMSCIRNASGFGWGVESYMRGEYSRIRQIDIK